VGAAVATVAVVALVAVVASVLGALAVQRQSARLAVAQARTEALAAARSEVATVLSYDYHHLNQDYARAKSVMTPAFRPQYDKTTASGVTPLARRYQAISTSVVTAAGSVQQSADRAIVLVFVAQTVTNNKLSAPRLDRSRIEVALVRSGGRWLINAMTPV
jgi:Mce-associated membrane protein